MDPPAHIRRVKGPPGEWRGSVPSGRREDIGVGGGK